MDHRRVSPVTTRNATCSRSASDTPIGAAVRALLREDNAGHAPTQCGKRPLGVNLSTFEDTLRDWGMIYGMCFALARGEDPWESHESVAERSLDIAWGTFSTWAHFEPPEEARSEALDDLERAYKAALPHMRQMNAEWVMRLMSAVESVVQEAGHTRES
jgi:hypothetical protein